MEAELANKRSQLGTGKTVPMAQMTAAEHMHARLHAAWALQKRRCLELVQLLAERTQADRKQLQDELGLERDEDFVPSDAYTSYN